MQPSGFHPEFLGVVNQEHRPVPARSVPTSIAKTNVLKRIETRFIFNQVVCILGIPALSDKVCSKTLFKRFSADENHFAQYGTGHQFPTPA